MKLATGRLTVSAAGIQHQSSHTAPTQLDRWVLSFSQSLIAKCINYPTGPDKEKTGVQDHIQVRLSLLKEPGGDLLMKPLLTRDIIRWRVSGLGLILMTQDDIKRWHKRCTWWPEVTRVIWSMCSYFLTGGLMRSNTWQAMVVPGEQNGFFHGCIYYIILSEVHYFRDKYKLALGFY